MGSQDATHKNKRPVASGICIIASHTFDITTYHFITAVIRADTLLPSDCRHRVCGHSGQCGLSLMFSVRRPRKANALERKMPPIHLNRMWTWQGPCASPRSSVRTGAMAPPSWMHPSMRMRLTRSSFPARTQSSLRTTGRRLLHPLPEQSAATPPSGKPTGADSGFPQNTAVGATFIINKDGAVW